MAFQMLCGGLCATVRFVTFVQYDMFQGLILVIIAPAQWPPAHQKPLVRDVLLLLEFSHDTTSEYGRGNMDKSCPHEVEVSSPWTQPVHIILEYGLTKSLSK